MQDIILKKDLTDRLDGLALLSEALSNSHPTGKLHEFMRLFERAFGLSSSKLIDPLSEFLSDSEGKYSKKEIQEWIYKLRHPATHADKKNFILESDVRPVIRRIEQAAYDVFFNKEKWHNIEPKRRKFFVAPAGIRPNETYVKYPATPTFEMQMLDPFGSYPADLSAHLNQLPKGWWLKQLDYDGKSKTDWSPLSVE